MRIHVHGIGIAAPGMGDWLTARSVLTGQSPFALTEVAPGSPAFLPPNERRRVSRTIKLALQVAHEAVQTASVPLGEISPVFASAWGDLEIMDRILTALTQPERPVSPTQFHNSVHNAAAGYWSIGIGAPLAASAIAADDATFAAGLLESAALAVTGHAPVLLVAYDLVPPAALKLAVPIAHTFATALLLASRAAPGSLALDLEVASGEPTPMEDAALESVRRANPIASALPLLLRLAERHGTAVLPYQGGTAVQLTVSQKAA